MKKKIVIVLILVFIFGGVGISGYWYFSGDKNKIEEIKVGENQSLVIAQINQIDGNEITYAIAKEADFLQNRSGEKGNSSTEENKDSQDNDREKRDNDNFGGRQNMPEGSMPQGERPGDMGEGSMPQREQSNDMNKGAMSSDKTEDSSEGQEGESDKKNTQRNKVMYTLTGEEETTLIPVGTTVTTQLGTTTTFSRLAVGDMIKLLMEKDKDGKDVIVGIWMI